MRLVDVLAWLWIVLGTVGIVASIVGAKHSATKLRHLREIGGLHRHHPMVILSQTHLRHHMSRMVAFVTGISIASIALTGLHLRLPEHTVAVLLTAMMGMFVADSFMDIVIRLKLVKMYEQGEFDA